MKRAAAALLALALPFAGAAQKQTVCTITVNSADEREAFRRHLPAEKFDFVELVERGRPDWLASACQKRVSCDVLVVSGHFAGNEFYSSRFDVAESLPIDELERIGCSDSCPDLFANLKEVYLFGCDSLKPEAPKSATPEIVRGLVRAGQSRAEAERVARLLSERHGESSRDRMRRVFSGVPLIYGFSSLAPYGRVAGPMLDRHLDVGIDEVGSGAASARLLKLFGPASMVATRGQLESDRGADYRAEACRYYDDRLTAADRVEFFRRVLGGEMPEVRMAFDRIERFFATLPAATRADPSFEAARAAMAADAATRAWYLALTRETQDPALRVRMVALARTVGWLTETEQRAELTRMAAEVIAAPAMAFGEVDLLCTLGGEGRLEPASVAYDARSMRTAQAAGVACMGSDAARVRVLAALASADEGEVQLAQAYLRHRPMDAAELRASVASVARMKQSGAQVRALEVIARHHVADREALDELARLFARSNSLAVQRAIAEIFIRAGEPAAGDRALAELFRRHRVKSPNGDDLIDTLIRRLDVS